jgi:3-oxoacyl-[acyl-carrier-protein] synthase II
MGRRVVITGMGAVTALGLGADNLWDAIRNGKSGITQIERINVADLPTRVGAEMKNFDPSAFVEKKELKRMDRFVQLNGLLEIHAWILIALIPRGWE